MVRSMAAARSGEIGKPNEAPEDELTVGAKALEFCRHWRAVKLKFGRQNKNSKPARNSGGGLIDWPPARTFGVANDLIHPSGVGGS